MLLDHDITYSSFPSLFMRLLACSLLGWWVPMFPRCMPLLYSWVVELSFQACSNVTLEDVAVLGECCPSSRDSSLNILVLVFVSGAVFLSQVDVAFNVLDRVLLTYIGVSFSIITFLFDLFIFRPWFSVSSANSCSISCSSCGVLAHMSMSSAKALL